MAWDNVIIKLGDHKKASRFLIQSLQQVDMQASKNTRTGG